MIRGPAGQRCLFAAQVQLNLECEHPTVSAGTFVISQQRKVFSPVLLAAKLNWRLQFSSWFGSQTNLNLRWFWLLTRLLRLRSTTFAPDELVVCCCGAAEQPMVRFWSTLVFTLAASTIHRRVWVENCVEIFSMESSLQLKKFEQLLKRIHNTKK